jgi:hypothetical protein
MLREEDGEFKANLSYIERPHVNKKTIWQKSKP